MISIEAYKDYLVEKEYKEFTDNGAPSTVGHYARYVELVRKERGFLTLSDMAKEIDTLVEEYDDGGKYSKEGERGHETCINALKRFKEFLASFEK